MRAAAAANSSSTRAGIITTAPAPIIAAARPTCSAFSDISARASANSLPTSLASCAIASPKSSGIERSVGEVIAITLTRCAARRGSRISGLRVAFRGAMQESHHAEPGEDRDSKERRGLPAGKRLRVAHQIIKVAVHDALGEGIDLLGRLTDICAGDWKIRVEFAGGAPHGFSDSTDILRSG